MYEPTIELSGHLGADPELRFTPNGAAVCDLRIATTPRRKVGEEWRDLETLWFTVVCWKQLAQNCAESFKKGDRVTVHGRLGQQSYLRADESVGTKWVIDALSVGADVSRAAVIVKRSVREGSAASAFPDKFADASASPYDGPTTADTDGPLVPFADEVERAA